MAKIHKVAAPRNRHHSVKTNAHAKGNLKIVAQKAGGKKHHKKGAHKSLLT